MQETWAERYEYRAAADQEIDQRYSEYGKRQKERTEELIADEDDEDLNYESEEDKEDDEQELNLEAFACSLRDWIAQDRTRRELLKKIARFFESYYDGIGDQSKKKLPPLYMAKIRDMCRLNKSSVEVSYDHIGKDACSQLAIWLIDVPKEMLELFDEALKDVIRRRFPFYGGEIAKEIKIRITDLPIIEKLRDLRKSNIGTLVRVEGVVTRRTGVFPTMVAIAYDCPNCGNVLGPIQTIAGVESRPGSCLACQFVGVFRVNASKSLYSNFQKITLQESPGSVPAGRVPRYKDVNLLGDLIDKVRPGEEVEIIGIYLHAQQTIGRDRSGFPVFSTLIEANSITSKSSNSNAFLTEMVMPIFTTFRGHTPIFFFLCRSVGR